jgi:hypothetical protein
MKTTILDRKGGEDDDDNYDNYDNYDDIDSLYLSNR